MVLSLELIDTDVVCLAKKENFWWNHSKNLCRNQHLIRSYL
jgi:hypothetical protein